ncbi:hypothetical protein HDV05_005250 [Chytridiales sp. JEL 0842]|nr:hypothetical protein HDV05_005250 [Chytridiales sp. JEL 0842]
MTSSPGSSKVYPASSPPVLALKHALLIGATAGVGASTAIRLASLGCTVHLVGRSSERGQEVLKKCQEASSSAASTATESLGAESAPPERSSANHNVHTFTSVDVTDFPALLSFLQSFKSKLQQSNVLLDYLVLSAGGMTTGSRQPTAQGFDTCLTQSCYSKYLIIHHLAPHMHPQSGKIVVVCSPGNGKMISKTDIDLEKHYSFMNYTLALPLYLDLTLEHLAQTEAAHVGVYHVFPGFLATRNKESFPWFFRRVLLPLLYVFASGPDAFAAKLVDEVLMREPAVTGYFMLSEKLAEMKKVADHTEENKKIVVDFVRDVVCKAFL